MRKILKQNDDNKVIVVQGNGDYIKIYTPERWEQVKQKLVESAEDEDRLEWLERVVLSTASERSFDRQGRIKLDGILVRRARLKGKTEALVMAVRGHVEIWDMDHFEEQFKTEAPYVYSAVKKSKKAKNV